jgi:hypothetical protein
MTNVTELNDALAANYLLVDVSLRSWAGKRTDKTVSGEVIANKGAVADAGKFTKFLLASADAELEVVKQNATALRAFVYSRTLPWSAQEDGAKRGARLLSGKDSLEFLKELNQFKSQYDQSVQVLASVWDRRVAEAKANLSGLSGDDHYPEASEIPALFNISVDMRPVPTRADFSRINIPVDLAEALATSAAADTVKQLNIAMDALKENLLKELHRMARQLGKAGREEKTRLYDTLATNMQGLVSLMRGMGATGNTSIVELADRIDRELLSQPVDVYRNSPSKALAVASMAEQIAADAAIEAIWNA